VYPGEGELEALALAGQIALEGEADIKEYVP
jgi:butyrate kinase